MHFGNPYHLLWLLLLLPAAALLYLTLQWKKQLREKLGDSRLVANLFATYSPGKFLGKGAIIIAAMLLLVLALTNLRRPDNAEKVKLSGTDLMIALDVSNSMMAQDVQPTRLDKAKLLIGKLIDQLQGNRIGLVVFAGNAYLQMPLTTDASAARLFLGTISPNLVSYQGTNVSEALQVCNRSFNTQEKKYKSILLITDGEDHDNTPLKTAGKLKEEGVVINTIGIGSPGGSSIMDPVSHQPRRDEQGNVVISKVNVEMLQEMATATNGSFILLQDADAAASQISRELESMDQKPINDTALTNYSSYYGWFVLAAALLLLAEIVLSETKKQRKMKTPALLLLLLTLSLSSFSQKENSKVRQGNDAYRRQDYANASTHYQAALTVNRSNHAAAFNLANSQFKTGKYDEAAQQYDAVATNTTDKTVQARSLYNKGLSQIKQQKLDDAIQSFKQSLRLNPRDEETRQNLQKALNEKKKQEQQQKDQQQKDDKNKDKKEKKDPKDDQQEKQDQNKDQQKDQQPPPKISKQEAEQKLQALRQEEKKLQQKLNDRQPTGIRQPEKDW